MRNVLQKPNFSRGRATTLVPSWRILKCETVAQPLLFLLAMAWCLSARGDIDCKPQYDANEPIVCTVTITDVPEGAKLRGSFAVSDGSYLPAGENVYHVWAATGKHTVTAQGVWVLTEPVIVGDKTIQVLVDFGQFSYSRTFQVGPGVPTPDPFPQPDPDPQPNPQLRRLVILEESGDRTAAQALLWRLLQKEFPQQSQLSILDDDQPSASKYLPQVQLAVRPVLLVLEADHLIRAIPCPASVSAIKQEIAK